METCDDTLTNIGRTQSSQGEGNTEESKEF
jgi:hypothetical protein